MSGACDALNIKPGLDTDMALLASRNPALQRQCYVVLPGLSHYTTFDKTLGQTAPSA